MDKLDYTVFLEVLEATDGLRNQDLPDSGVSQDDRKAKRLWWDC